MIRGMPKERVEFATERKHFEEAFGLVYKEYVQKGYCSPNPSQMRVLFYSALPETVTFCLWREQTLLATATLIPDSPAGLPMEEVYPDEIKKLRKEGRKLCEVSSLALNSDVISSGILPLYFAERLRALYHIFKPIFWYTRNTINHTDLCIAMNPIHKLLYSSLHFEEFGTERVYESVNGNPSIAMRLNFDGIEERGKRTPGLHKLFLGSDLNIKRISDIFRWNQADFNYFFVESSSALKNAKPQQIEYLKNVYPEFSIHKTLPQNDALPLTGEKIRTEKRYGFTPSEKELVVPKSLEAKYEDPSGSVRRIKVLNISRGGLCIENDAQLAEGTSLKLNLNIKDQMIRAQGEVVWNSKVKQGFLHGIRFTFIEPESREPFNTFIMDWAAEQIAEELDFSALKPIPAFPEMERRSFARLKIPLRADFKFEENGLLVQTHIQDLSEGGLCLISDFELKKDQEVTLKLWLDQKQTVSLKGIVRYGSKKSDGNQTLYFNGIEFSNLEDPAAKTIADFLAFKRSELGALEISLDDIVARTTSHKLR